VLAAASASSSAFIDPDSLVEFPEVAVELAVVEAEPELAATLETSEPELKETFLNLIGSKKLLSSTIMKPSPEATMDAEPELVATDAEPELVATDAEAELPTPLPELALEPYNPYMVLLVELTIWFLS
jgi:hypothetical protein